LGPARVHGVEFVRRQGLGPAAVGLRLPTPRYAGSAAVLALGSRRVTHCTRCARCVQTDAASQSWMRAGTRADPRAAVLAVADATPQRPAPSLARTFGSLSMSSASHGHRARRLPRAAGALAGRESGSMPGSYPSLNKERLVLRKAVGGWAVARLWGGEARRVSVGVRTRTLPKLTRCVCLNETSAASEVSYAARPKPKHRSAVEPQAKTATAARHRTPAHGLATSQTVRSSCLP
jgi:hypothetical protein